MARAADLSVAQLYPLLALRIEVFVIEQNCPYQELDGHDLDPDTRHLWIGSDEVPLAYLRLRRDAEAFRIGRVCVAAAARRRGLARRLMEAALAEVGDTECVLDAQTYATDLYAAFGFRPEGAEFLDDGVPHIRMRRR